jgi:hypothetical protein
MVSSHGLEFKPSTSSNQNKVLKKNM